MMLDNQDQRPGESVSSIDKIADLLVGDQDTDQQDTRNDADQPDVSNVDDNVVDQSVTEDNEQDVDLTWSKALGLTDNDISLDDDGNFLGIKVVVNGKDELVPVSELKNGYQFNKANTQKAQALAEERRQLEEIKTNVVSEYTKQLQNAAKLNELLAKKFLADYESLDWVRLRAEKPGEYAALQREFDVRRAEVQNIYSAIEAEQANIINAQSSETQQKFNNHLAKQAELVINNNPDWQNVDTFKSAMSDMVKFVGDAYGFSSDEFNSVYDARLIELIKDAMAFRKGKTNIEAGVLQKVPKFQKSGGKQRQSSKLDQLIKTAKTAKGSAKRNAETDAIAALLLG